MKERLKRLIFGLLGKDPEAVVVTFASGDPELCRRMFEEVQALVPDRRHFFATPDNWSKLRPALRKYRIGLAPVMLGNEPNSLRRAAFRFAPRKILAYNSRLERHHLRPTLASFLFFRGVPLDRIYLRPRWWPFPRREHSTVPKGQTVLEGRPSTPGRRRIAVLSPYFPYPLSHGGAVRIYHILREMARDFDIELFAFTDGTAPETAPILEICARVVLVEKPRYREPRWSTLLPPDVHEFESDAMRKALSERTSELLQVEYTQLARYNGDILVEHDVTFDLAAQVGAKWDLWRWRRFELAQTRRYRRVVVMSPKDAAMLPNARTVVIENGVDLDRFRPEPETPGQRILFVGSFRHFPNVEAYRFFTEQVWPMLRDRFPHMGVTVVCGADHLTYWRAFADTPEPPPDNRIRLLGFVSDVRPLYVEANIVVVPTTASAGTNVKVLEAMAMRRAVVSTTSGCAGLGLEHGRSVWIDDSPDGFARGIAALAKDSARRAALAAEAYEHAQRNFDWRAIGRKQRELLESMLGSEPA